MGIPKNGWFITTREIPLESMIGGIPILGNHHMSLDFSEHCLISICFARDVALQKLRSHEALEEHCRGIYKELTRELPAPMPVSLGIQEH